MNSTAATSGDVYPNYQFQTIPYTTSTYTFPETPLMVLPLAGGKVIKICGSLPTTDEEIDYLITALRNASKLTK